MNDKIQCPSCGVFLDEALSKKIEEKFAHQQKVKEAELDKKKQEIELRKQQLEEKLRASEIELNKRVNEGINAQKPDLWKQAREEAEKIKAAEIKLLEEQVKDGNKKLADVGAEAVKLRLEKEKFENERQNFEVEKTKIIEKERKQIEEAALVKAKKQNKQETAALQRKLEEIQGDNEMKLKIAQDELREKDEKIQKARDKELELMKGKARLEEERKDMELQVQRKLEEGKKLIEESVAKRVTEEQYLKNAEKDKQMNDMRKQIDDLRRKAEQSSQQMQGEVLELELEELLQKEFVQDKIEPVRKGVNGADVIHKVKNRFGSECGKIIWELKRTKTWSEGFIQKLKDDQRDAGADIAVIISINLPQDAQGKPFTMRDGVFICDIKCAVILAQILRYDLMKLAEANNALVGKKEKMDLVYAYINSIEFKQRIQGVADAFIEMKKDLDREKRALKAIWAKREKQIECVLDNTLGFYSDLRGLTGGTLQEIKALELPESETKEKEN